MTSLQEGYIPQPPPPPEPPRDTAGRVKWLRELRGTSIRKACEETGVSKGDWDGIEAGHRGPRFLDNLRRISLAWTNDQGEHVDFNWLLAWDVAEPPFPVPPAPKASRRVTRAPGKSPTRRNKVYCSTTSANSVAKQLLTPAA